jgi:two-component system cell cycle response regulator DivK
MTWADGISPFASRAKGWRRSEMGTMGMAKTVLIVEDNELNMKLFHDLLEAHGYNTVATRNGVEAIDLARKHRTVIAITAFAMKGDEERIRQGGCEAYLSKPISVAKFIETIRQFLGAPQGERQ